MRALSWGQKFVAIDGREAGRTWRRLYAVWMFVLGNAWWLGGPDRLVSPAFSTINRWADVLGAGPHQLGLILVTAGFFALSGNVFDSLTLRLEGYLMGLVGSWVLAVGATLAAVNEPTASLTGIATYSVLGVGGTGILAARAGMIWWKRRERSPLGEPDRT